MHPSNENPWIPTPPPPPCESTLDDTTRDITDHWVTIACTPLPVLVSSAYLASIEEKVSWVSCLTFLIFFFPQKQLGETG